MMPRVVATNVPETRGGVCGKQATKQLRDFWNWIGAPRVES